jgi:hypothetical protein
MKQTGRINQMLFFTPAASGQNGGVQGTILDARGGGDYVLSISIVGYQAVKRSFTSRHEAPWTRALQTRRF